MLKIPNKYTRSSSGRLYVSPELLTNTNLILKSNWCSRLILGTCDHPPLTMRIKTNLVTCRLAPNKTCRNIGHEPHAPWQALPLPCGHVSVIPRTLQVNWPMTNWQPPPESAFSSTASLPIRESLDSGMDSSQVPCAGSMEQKMQRTAGLVIQKHIIKSNYMEVQIQRAKPIVLLSTYLVILLHIFLIFIHSSSHHHLNLSAQIV